MRAVSPRSNTPAGTDSGAVEPSSTGDMTEREAAPPAWPAPAARVTLPPPFPADGARSRKETLASPIPALLATQMGEFADDLADATPLPVEMRQEATSRFDIGAQRALLSADHAADDAEYVVELVDSHKREP